MLLALFLLFVVLPVAELFVLIWVGSHIGVLATFGLMVLFTVAGIWLCKREGLGVLRRMNQHLDRGEAPTKELLDGVLVLLAGALLIVPGFITDVAGLALLLPPVRALLRSTLLRRLQRRIDQAMTAGSTAGFRFVQFGGGDGWVGGWDGDGFGEVVDVDSYEVPFVPGGPPELDAPRTGPDADR
jgi:UPF0716 protein FxsA